MTPDHAENLVARTLSAIDALPHWQHNSVECPHHAADRERVSSDLAGLLDSIERDQDVTYVRNNTARCAARASLYGCEVSE